MSGIYIKGMEMPDRCFSCPMCDTDCCGVSHGSYIEYREVDVDTAMNGRPGWCPLISVPDHGRLGDLDELKRTFCEECLLYPDKCLKEECDRQGPYHIEHMARVVIPADESVGNSEEQEEKANVCS